MNGCEKVFHTMKEKGMDLAVLLDPADIKYLSGFEKRTDSAGCFRYVQK